MKKVYERCGKVTELYVTTHPEDFRIGGPGVVLIVDEYPGGLMAVDSITDVTITKKRNNNYHTIMCIAEATLIPPRMWLHMIKTMPEVNYSIYGCFGNTSLLLIEPFFLNICFFEF